MNSPLKAGALTCPSAGQSLSDILATGAGRSAASAASSDAGSASSPAPKAVPPVAAEGSPAQAALPAAEKLDPVLRNRAVRSMTSELGVLLNKA
eukprot:6629754-Lingulodinium_polyedra.AAC.1